ncbi:MAG TPA: hypothetical protein VFO79_08730 [Xanthomonadales bacterium]|nr:hypothetical protein [Xanthomonadales bacterium]
MTTGSTGEGTTSRLVIGLAMCAGGLLLLALAPHRTLTCAHAARPPVASACMAAEAASSGDGAIAARGGALVATSDCPLPPDIQCRLEARIVGLIPSEDARFSGIRDFDLLEEWVKARASERARTGGMERNLQLVGAEGPVDPGWHGQSFATPAHHARLLAFARSPGAARIVLTDSPKLGIAVGFVMLALGGLVVLGVISDRYGRSY